MEIAEDVLISTVVLSVSATDRDSGLNGLVSYRLDSHSLLRYGDTFGVKNQTGSIYTKSLLSYDVTNVYHLTVVAEDQAVNRLQAYARVTYIFLVMF